MCIIPVTTECNTLYETYQIRQLLFTLQMLVSLNLITIAETYFWLKSDLAFLFLVHFSSFQPLTHKNEKVSLIFPSTVQRGVL